jgi:hypothetical protein
MFSREVDKQDRTLTKTEGDLAVTLFTNSLPYSGISSVQPGPPLRYVHIVGKTPSLNAQSLVSIPENGGLNSSFVGIHSYPPLMSECLSKQSRNHAYARLDGIV